MAMTNNFIVNTLVPIWKLVRKCIFKMENNCHCCCRRLRHLFNLFGWKFECSVLDAILNKRDDRPVEWILQITRDALDKARTAKKNKGEKKWSTNVRRKKYFVRVYHFPCERVHNGYVMNFLISISTIYLSIFFMSNVLFRWLRRCQRQCANWLRTYFRIVSVFINLIRDPCNCCLFFFLSQLRA